MRFTSTSVNVADNAYRSIGFRAFGTHLSFGVTVNGSAVRESARFVTDRVDAVKETCRRFKVAWDATARS